MDYSPPSSACNFNAEEELARLAQYLQSSREAHKEEKERERQERIREIQRELLRKKQREAKLPLDSRRRPPWKVGESHIFSNFETKPRNLPAGDISPTVLHRTKHFLPRTFHSPDIPFVSIARSGNAFNPADPQKVFSRSALAMLKQREEEFEREVDRRCRMEPMRKTVVFEKKWEPTHSGGRFFSMPHSDKNYLYERSPKDHPSQSKPFLRTKCTGDFFSK